MNLSADQSRAGSTVELEKSLRKGTDFVQGQPDLTCLCFVNDVGIPLFLESEFSNAT
jgi:hypothetical protein